MRGQAASWAESLAGHSRSEEQAPAAVEWNQVFSDEVLVTAVLDRLLHRCAGSRLADRQPLQYLSARGRPARRNRPARYPATADGRIHHPHLSHRQNRVPRSR
ncbi:ATP-binding protein [Streptomyces sp. NPDC087901]|uniref:ATP-binding protein n=1 Tax=Streptomyces sp. NPDC087901 TaxID=3365818 RepID=UPI0037FA5381